MNNKIVIEEKNSAQRLDKFLLKYFNKAPKSLVYKLLRKKRIKLNGKKADGSEMLVSGDEILLYLSDDTMSEMTEEKTVRLTKQTVCVVFEDEQILVVDKPKGVLIHAEKPSDTDTLVDRVIAYAIKNGFYNPSDNLSFAPVAVNRLDRNTSGLVVCAKTLHAAQWLSECFRERLVEKNYTAVVSGVLKDTVTIDESLEKDGASNTVKVGVGKTAKTIAKPIFNGDDYTVLDIQLITGRTHQIRAHVSHIGRPIIGDTKYGNKKVNEKYRKFGITSQLLHASRLTFQPKEGKLSYICGKTFEAKLPECFYHFIME